MPSNSKDLSTYLHKYHYNLIKFQFSDESCLSSEVFYSQFLLKLKQIYVKEIYIGTRSQVQINSISSLASEIMLTGQTYSFANLLFTDLQIFVLLKMYIGLLGFTKPSKEVQPNPVDFNRKSCLWTMYVCLYVLICLNSSCV